MSLLFDAPYWLIVLLAVAGIVVAYMGMNRQQKNLRTAGIALLGIAALLLVLRFTVETDEKRIEKQSRALIEAVSKNDWTTAGQYIKQAELESTNLSGDDLAKYGRDAYKLYGLTDVKLNSVDIKRQPNVITATIAVTSHHTGVYVDTVPSTWNLEYQKNLDGWVLMKIIAVKIGFGDTGNPKDFFPKK
jgi:hypothetical protein